MTTVETSEANGATIPAPKAVPKPKKKRASAATAVRKPKRKAAASKRKTKKTRAGEHGKMAKAGDYAMVVRIPEALAQEDVGLGQEAGRQPVRPGPEGDRAPVEVAEVRAGIRRWAVLCGDCLELLPAVGCVDHVITDPPYDERTHASAISGHVKAGAGLTFAALSDPSAMAKTLLRYADRWCLAFGSVESMGAYRDGAGKGWVRSGIWDKINPTPQLTGDRPGQAVEAIAIMHSNKKKRWNKRGECRIWRLHAATKAMTGQSTRPRSR